MKRYDIDALGSSTGEWWNATWRMVERYDGAWVKAEEAEQVERENETLKQRLLDVAWSNNEEVLKLKERLCAVTQTLVEGVGTKEPMSVEEAATMAVEVLREADDINAKLKTERAEIERNIDALSGAAGIDRLASIGDAVQGAVDAIHRLKEAPRRLANGEREKELHLLRDGLEVVASAPSLLTDLMRIDSSELARTVARRIDGILDGAAESTYDVAMRRSRDIKEGRT